MKKPEQDEYPTTSLRVRLRSLAQRSIKLAQLEKSREAAATFGRNHVQQGSALIDAGQKQLQRAQRIWFRVRIGLAIMTGLFVLLIMLFLGAGKVSIVIALLLGGGAYIGLTYLARLAVLFLANTPVGASVRSALGIANAVRPTANRRVVDKSEV